MFPLKQREIGGYKFGDKTFYNSFHIGVDYKANQTPLYAPFDGGVTTSVGPQGGNTIHFWPDHDKVEIRFLHLAKFVKTGRVKQGELIAITGNTGSETTKPHLHLDISKGSLQLKNIKNFIDPEKYIWEKGKPMNPNIIIYKNGSEYQVAFRATSQQGLAQQLLDGGCGQLVNTDGTPNFTEIDKIAKVL